MNIEKIRRYHDPERDWPNGSSPPVTWVEMELAEECHALRSMLGCLQDVVLDLQYRVGLLEDQNERLKLALGDEHE